MQHLKSGKEAVVESFDSFNDPRNREEIKYDLIDIIHVFCSRPKLYFENGSFALMVEYLSGYACGRGGDVQKELTAFRQWIAIRCGVSHGLAQNHSWDTYLKKIYTSEEEIWINLPILYAEFLGSKPSTASE
jgi:hypothetical protein